MTRKDIESIPGRAIMQYSGNQAYMEEEKVVILSPGKKPGNFKYINKELLPVNTENKALEKKALAHSIWPTMAYQKRLYRTKINKI